MGFCAFRRFVAVQALLSLSAMGQTTTSGQSVVFQPLFTKQSSLGRSVIFVNVQGMGITNHVVTWTVAGGPTGCTLLIEKSTDAVTWTTESTETCTTNGAKTLADASYNYLTVNLSALSGGTNPSVTVEYRGYLPGQGIPVRPGEGGTGTTTAFTTGSVVFAGSSGVYQQDNANFFWNNTSKRLCLLSNACVNTFDVGAGKAFITASGAGTFSQATAKSDAAGNTAFTAQGFSGQTADIVQVKNSGGTVLASVDKSGIPKGNRLNDNVPLHGTVKADYTVATAANTTTETALNSFSIPANSLAANRVIRVTATGVYSTANGTDTVTVRAKVGGTAWHSVVSTAAAVTNVQWSLSWVIVAKTIGASGDAESQLPWAFVNGVFKSDPNTAVESIDTTQARTLELTAQWSAAAASNTISVRQFVVEVLN